MGIFSSFEMGQLSSVTLWFVVTVTSRTNGWDGLDVYTLFAMITAIYEKHH